MLTLDRVLARLVYKRSCRRDFIEGRSVFDVPDEDRAALDAIDRDGLSELAERIAREVMTRRHSGSGALPNVFPRTIGAFVRAQPEGDALLELAYRFMDSSAFDGYRELPFCGIGWSLEEAFFRFCEAEDIGDSAVREEEFLGAMMKLLSVSPRAAVTLPPSISRTVRGFLSVTARGAPTLYAAVDGRIVVGKLTPFLADLLAPGADGARVAAQHGVSLEVLGEAIARFRTLGILGS